MNPPPQNRSDLVDAPTQPIPPRSAGGAGGGGDDGGSGGFYHGDEGPHLPDPDRIGPYRIHRRLGAGGMGSVYLATREGDQSHARVALKVIKRGKDTEEIIGRFEQERRLLAALNHDHIARLLDASVTAEGQPYFVMEYVDGLAIDEYCDTNRLPISKRLELFRTLCQAVHYAHQNLIVHRDIKSSNVVVTPDGKVKLLDFGIAKLINPALGFHAAAPTHTLHGPMTPEYASPEQVRGDPISTVSDVYSLGVLLYELVTGRRPYRLKSALNAELIRVICEEDPERPSTAVTRAVQDGTTTAAHGRSKSTAKPTTMEDLAKLRESRPERLRRLLTGDIDNIVLKAMDKAPRRRYESAEQLSQDIHRHLSGMPIIARPPNLPYVIRKFVSRNKGPVLATAAIFVLLVTGLTMSLILMQKAERARIEAVQARDRFNQLRTYATNAFFKINLEVGGSASMTLARRSVLQELDRFLDHLKGQGDSMEIRADRAKAVTYKGDILGGGHQAGNLGRPDEAIAEYRRAIEWWNDLGRETALGRESQWQLAMLYFKIGDVLTYQKRFAEADPELTKAEHLVDELDQGDSKVKDLLAMLLRARADWHILQIQALQNADEIKQHFVDGRDLIRKSVALREQQVAANPNDSGSLRELTIGMNRQAEITEMANTPKARQEALVLYRNALDKRLALQTLDPDKSQRDRDVATSRMSVGRMLMILEDYTSAATEIVKAHELIEERVREDPHDSRLPPILGKALCLLGDAGFNLIDHGKPPPEGYSELDQPDTVRNCYRRSAEIFETLVDRQSVRAGDGLAREHAETLRDVYAHWSKFEERQHGNYADIGQKARELAQLIGASSSLPAEVSEAEAK